MSAAAIDRAPVGSREIVPVYVWEVPVRLAHWLIALSIAVLSATGLYLGHPFMTVPGPAEQSFVMGWAKVIHGYGSYVFACAFLMRLIWMFTGNHYSHWDKFLSHKPSRLRGFMPTVSFYSFLRDRPPSFVGHNPVASSAYTLVYGLCAWQVITGLILRGASADVSSVVHGFGAWAGVFGGLAMVRWFHHITMWLLIGFAVHHVYSAVLMASIEKNGTMDSIFSGYKWVPRHDLEAGPYRWNNKGTIDE